jgi:hypothetical protein
MSSSLTSKNVLTPSHHHIFTLLERDPAEQKIVEKCSLLSHILERSVNGVCRMIKPGDASEAAKEAASFLFLDVDGVLNTCLMSGGARVHPKLMRRLASIVKETNCGVILSSTWRLDEHYYSVLLDALNEVGVNSESIIGFTPTIEPKRNLRQDGTYGVIKGAVELQRCQEILAWLDEHRLNQQRWAVLDDLNLADIKDTTVINKMRSHLVKTNPEAGLTENNVQQVTCMLLGGTHMRE